MKLGQMNDFACAIEDGGICPAALQAPQAKP
jgi:hypothetical protein